MIGVIADREEEDIVREFFELFKTPWEFHRTNRRYDVVLCSGGSNPQDVTAKLFVQYAGRRTDFDAARHIEVESQRKGAEISLLGKSLPIYGNTITFAQSDSILTEQTSGKAVAYVNQCGGQTFARVGYDLFREVQSLLTTGQPNKNAAVPALDLHIDFLRQLITCSGIPLVEIPPVPDGSPFIVCLTHDLDHASIRRHKFDSTIIGFLYRAIVGSTINLARGRFTLSKLFTNWAAAAKLPLIYLGLAKDIWYEFDRYLDLEDGRPSTFFVIPIENNPGRSANGRAPGARASRYDVSHIAAKISRLKGAGCEIGLHGIDAWLESSKGRDEARRISEISATTVMGVRMHWLYSDLESPKVLEQAEFSYDSTVGYNDTVGYRAGTAQAFKPLRANRLLELPLLVMDTALFYPDYLDLSEDQAWQWVAPLLDNATNHGGVVTINWHDRSIAPERLWGDFYERLLRELTCKGAQFSTAAQAASWFRRRRSAVFERLDSCLRVTVTSEDDFNLPGFRLRLHQPRSLSSLRARHESLTGKYTDTAFTDSIDTSLQN